MDPGPALCNPWSLNPDSRPNRQRRRNLRIYLETLAETAPRTMLVGEALGYRGGCLSGIPFTSLDQITRGGHPLLEPSRGYLDPGDGGRVRAEASATMIWESFDRLPSPPLLWNACPFHPHAPGRPQSNRPPRSGEVSNGARFLLRIARLFEVDRFVAVGRVASAGLSRLGIEHDYVRHPSVGGKRQYLDGLAQLGSC